MTQQQIVWVKGNKKYLHPFKLVLLLFCIFVPVLTFIFSFFDTHYFYDAIFFGFIVSMFLGLGRVLLFYPRVHIKEPINFVDNDDDDRRRREDMFSNEKFYNPGHPLYHTFHKD